MVGRSQTVVLRGCRPPPAPIARRQTCRHGGKGGELCWVAILQCTQISLKSSRGLGTAREVAAAARRRAGGRQRANTQAGSSSSKQLVFCIAGLLLAWLSTSCGIEEGVAGLARPVARARSCTAGASGATRRLGPVSPSRQQCSIL